LARVCAISASSREMVCRRTCRPPTILPVTAHHSVVNGLDGVTAVASEPRPHGMPLSWIMRSGGMS
jgi:hypothetical protein